MIVNAFIRWYQSFYHPFSWSGPFSISTKGSDVVPVCSSKLSIEDINLILNSSFASSSFVHQTLVSSVTDSNWIPNSPSILLNFCFICYQWPCAQKSRIDTVKIFSAWMGCYNEQNLKFNRDYIVYIKHYCKRIFLHKSGENISGYLICSDPLYVSWLLCNF